MNNFLLDFEEKLRSIIEGDFFTQTLNNVPISQLAHKLSLAFEAEIEFQKTNTFNFSESCDFILFLHPSKLALWEHDLTILKGLNNAFQQTAEQAGFHYSNKLRLKVASDNDLKPDDIIIRVERPADLEKTSIIKVDETLIKIIPAFLIIEGKKVININENVISVGRREGNDILIKDPRVSRDHAQIRFVKDHFVIFDLNSTGGTFVNDQRISETTLYAGDLISLAGYTMIFGQDKVTGIKPQGETMPMAIPKKDNQFATENNMKSNNEKDIA